MTQRPSITIVNGIDELKEVCRTTSAWTMLDVLENPDSIMFSTQGGWFIGIWIRLGMPEMPAIKFCCDDGDVVDSLWLFPRKYENCRDIWIAFNKGQKTVADLENAITSCWLADTKAFREDFVERVELVHKAKAKQDEVKAAMAEASKKEEEAKLAMYKDVGIKIDRQKWEEINTAVAYSIEIFRTCQCPDSCLFAEGCQPTDTESYYHQKYAGNFDAAMKTTSVVIEMLKSNTVPERYKIGLTRFLGELNKWSKAAKEEASKKEEAAEQLEKKKREEEKKKYWEDIEAAVVYNRGRLGLDSQRLKAGPMDIEQYYHSLYGCSFDRAMKTITWVIEVLNLNSVPEPYLGGLLKFLGELNKWSKAAK
jgi:hypothetical protein